jgi:ribonuclease E
VSATPESETPDAATPVAATPIAATLAPDDGPSIVEPAGSPASEGSAPRANVEPTETPAEPAPIGFTTSGMTNGDDGGDGGGEDIADEPPVSQVEAGGGDTVEATPEPAPEPVAVVVPEPEPEPEETASAGEPNKPKRRGWWQRGGLF